MKEMTIDDVKTVSLDVLQDFHDFCMSHNLRYSLGFGSLIGAIRHQGYIPWDDDIDITMPRPDYELFFKLYQNNENFAAYDYNHGGALLAFGRLCEMKRTFVDTSRLPWLDKSTGVWIDIFPLDGSEDDISILKLRMSITKKKWHKGLIMRSSIIHFSDCPTFIRKVKLFIKKLMFAGQNLNSLIENHINECKKYDWENCIHVGHFSHLGNKINDLWLKEDFESTELHEFQRRKFCICSGYDRVLKMLYGDYMQLPPIEERIPRHSFNKFYWK